MKINKKLLFMKAHYFLLCAGSAPIFPFLPVILKDLGFSSISVGWIFTMYPLLVIVCKPLFGSIADRFRCHRFITIFLLFFLLISLFRMQWIPGLPTNTTAEFFCDGSKKLGMCSEKLNDLNIKNKIEESLKDGVICKVETEHLYKVLINGTSNNDTAEYSGNTENLLVTFKLGPTVLFKKTCMVAEISEIKTFNFLNTKKCQSNISILSNVYCEDAIIMESFTMPVVGEGHEMGTHQFWIVFFAVINVKMVISIIQSFSDAFCLALLGDKPENYGMQRMWGAVGWGLVSFVNGFVIDQVSKGVAKKNFLPSYYISLVLLLIDVIIFLNIKVKFNTQSKNILQDVGKSLKDLRICLFLLWCFVCGCFCAVIWNFLFWFIEDVASLNPNFDKTWMKTLEGLVLTVQCYFGEIPFFFFSGWILRKIGHPKAMITVLFFHGARFLCYSFISNPWWVLPIEAFNGITFGLFYTTMVTYANAIAPPGTEATIQNLVGSIFEGAGVSVGSLLGGYLFQNIGSSRTVFILGISSFVISIIYLFFQKKLEAKKETAENNKEIMEYGKDGKTENIHLKFRR